jgi:Ser/Thr protein kinase RdoA (MazF antagonist)
MDTRTAHAVATAYGLGTPLGEPVYADRGERGQIWRLVTGRGRFAVKETDIDIAEEDAAADVAFQRAAAAAGVPLPAPVLTGDGRVLLPGARAGSPAAWLRVYEWVDLLGDIQVSGAEIGAAAASLHRVEHPARGPVHPWFAEPMGAPAWESLLATAVAAGAWWAEPLERRLPALIALEAVVEPPDPAATRACHRDLNVENVRRRRDGGPIVLDWENSGALEPVRELAMVVVHLREDVSRAAALSAYRSYVEAGGPARVTCPADFSTAVVVQGHLLRNYGERSLDLHATAEGEERACEPRSPGQTSPADDRHRTDRRLRAALDRPLTPASLDDLLSSVRSYA